MIEYPMTSKEYRAALEEMELTQGRASWLFGGKSDRSGRRWAQHGAPYQVAVIIALMRRLRLTPEYIDALGAPWRGRKKG